MNGGVHRFFGRAGWWSLLLAAGILISGCRVPAVAGAPSTLPAESQRGAATPTQTSQPASTPTPELPHSPTVKPGEPTPTPGAAAQTDPSPTAAPVNWQDWPVVPAGVSQRAREIYRRGLALGNNPLAFSKVGDCGGTPAWFLGDFDRGPRFYTLGDYSNLQEVIAAFQGSYGRTSLAAKSGMNASSAFVPLWADRKFCEPGEFPIACEYRVHRPSFVLIMLGTNDVWHPERFEPQMRRIIEFYIENGVVPVLSTKADNLEGDGSINAAIVRLAREYEIPLWNYWRAVQALPDGGLQEDGAHLTFGRNFFDQPEEMQKAWPVRNLTALQALDAVWRGVTQAEPQSQANP